MKLIGLTVVLVAFFISGEYSMFTIGCSPTFFR